MITTDNKTETHEGGCSRGPHPKKNPIVYGAIVAKKKDKKNKKQKKITRAQVAYYARKAGYEVDEHGNIVHQLVWAKAYGKPSTGWVVHHVNQIKKDNRLENLVAIPETYHGFIHNLMKKDPDYENRFTKEFLMEKRDQFILIDDAYQATLVKAEQDKIDWMNGLRREAAAYPPPRPARPAPEVVFDAPVVILRKKVDDHTFSPGLFDDVQKTIDACKALRQST